MKLFSFIGAGSLIWILGHVYLWHRLVRPARANLSRAQSRAIVVLFVLLGVGGPLSMMMRRLPTSPWVSGSRYVGYVILGLVALVFSFTLLRDLVWGVLALAQRLSAAWRRRRAVEGAAGGLSLLPVDPERRRFLFNATSAGVLATASAGTGVGYWMARRRPPVKHIDVPVEGLHPDLDGLRIAQLSDVHVGPTVTAEDLSAMVDAINAEAPDVVAITGDLVDGFPDQMGEDISALSRLQTKLGAYYCTGNHEYYWDGPGWCEVVASNGVRVLNNEHVVIERGGAKLLIGGVTDIRAGNRAPGHETNPHGAMAGAPEVDYRIALAHQPTSVYEVSKAGFDLQLSGHTHGGQFFPFMLFVGLVHPFVAGLHAFEAMQIYVSTGAGYWGPPMRLGVSSEIPVLTLRRV